jgi:hypothetical protein
MTEYHNRDQPGYVAGEPEHCHKCYRLILTGEMYYETGEGEWLCEQCAGSDVPDTIQVTDDLVVELVPGQLRVSRGGKAIIVRLDEVRHLVGALANGAAHLAETMVDGKVILAEALGSDW